MPHPAPSARLAAASDPDADEICAAYVRLHRELSAWLAPEYLVELLGRAVARTLTEPGGDPRARLRQACASELLERMSDVLSTPADEEMAAALARAGEPSLREMPTHAPHVERHPEVPPEAAPRPSAAPRRSGVVPAPRPSELAARAEPGAEANPPSASPPSASPPSPAPPSASPAVPPLSDAARALPPGPFDEATVTYDRATSRLTAAAAAAHRRSRRPPADDAPIPLVRARAGSSRPPTAHPASATMAFEDEDDAVTEVRAPSASLVDVSRPRLQLDLGELDRDAEAP